MDAEAAIKLHDDLLAAQPEGAKHDRDICTVCVDRATQDAPPRPIPPADGGPDASDTNQHESQTNTEGGTPRMTDISQEAHEALVVKAVTDATAATDKALGEKAAEVTDLAAKVTSLEAEVSTLKEDNARLNSDLDKAQVDLKAATDKVAGLEKDAADKAEAAEKAERASKRLDQVKNLKVFPETFLSTERAGHWATLSDEDWAARIEEWGQLKPADSKTDDKSDDKKTETASAMTGTSGDLTDEASKTQTTPTPARRAVLGLS